MFFADPPSQALQPLVERPRHLNIVVYIRQVGFSGSRQQGRSSPEFYLFTKRTRSFSETLWYDLGLFVVSLDRLSCQGHREDRPRRCASARRNPARREGPGRPPNPPNETGFCGRSPSSPLSMATKT